MSNDIAEIESALSKIPGFLVDSNENLRKSSSNRYRNFIIARKIGDKDGDPENLYSFGEVPLPTESLDQLHGLVYKKITSEIESLQDGEKELVKYGEGQSDHDYLKYLTEDEFPLLEVFDDILNPRNFESTQYHKDPSPSFQATRILSPSDEMVVGFQYYWDNQLLGNTSLFNLYYRDHEHVPMDEPIISIPRRMDAIYHDGVIFILNDWQFEQMFEYYRYYEEVADEVLETIDESGIEFVDQGMVESAIQNNPIMMRKLKDVKDANIYDTIDIDDVEWVIGEYDLEGIDVRQHNGERQIDIENKIKVWQFLHIMNDDHVESELTKRAYQASDKREL